jgi:hypothetical protein
VEMICQFAHLLLSSQIFFKCTSREPSFTFFNFMSSLKWHWLFAHEIWWAKCQ